MLAANLLLLVLHHQCKIQSMATENMFSINESLYNKYPNPGNLHLYRQELDKLNGIIENYGQLLGTDLTVYLNCKGIMLEKMNRNAEAIEAFEAALKTDPAYIHSLISIAFTYGKINNFEKSLHYYELACQQQPGFAIIYKSRAIIYRKNEKFHLALQDCDKALALQPQNPEVISLKAEYLLELRRLKDAEKFIEDNLGSLKESIYLNYTQGLLLAYRSEVREALEHFLHFADQYNNVDVCIKIAQCYYSLNDFPAFFRHLELAKNIDRYYLQVIMLELLYCINSGDYYKGMQLALNYIQEVGPHHAIYCQLAFFYRRIGFFDRSESAIAEALKINGTSIIVLQEQISHYREMDDLQTALGHANALSGIFEFEGLKELAAIYLTIENREKIYQTRSLELLESYRNFTKAYTLFKSDSELLEVGALILSRANKLSEALRLMDDAIKLFRGMFTVYRTRANILHLHKQYRDAIAMYTSSISLNGNIADNYFNRGFCHQHLDEGPQAVSDFTEGIKKYISNSVSNPGLKLSKFKPANAYLLAALRQEEIWFSHPCVFNDALDCNFLQDYWAQNTPLKASLDSVFVCCFRKLEENENPETNFFFNENLMWAHYADSYRGVQLIYEVTSAKSQVSYRGDHVTYSDTLEMPVSESNYDLLNSVNRTLRLGFFNKFKDWQYEKEFRVLTMPDETGSKFIGYKTEDLGFRLSAVVFGLNCNAEFKKELAAIITSYQYPVSLTEIVKGLGASNHFTLLKKRYLPDSDH